MSSLLKKMMDRSTAIKSGAVAAVSVAASSAHAALPAEATNALSALSGNATDLLAAIWPIVAVVAGGFALVRLFKRGARAAV